MSKKEMHNKEIDNFEIAERPNREPSKCRTNFRILKDVERKKNTGL